MKILFVCLGNICRSPLAEGILRAQATANGLNWQIDSAGTNGFHTGECPHPLSVKVAKLHGIDITTQRSRKFEPQDFDMYDMIYVMAEDVMEEVQRIAGNAFNKNKCKYFLQENPGSAHNNVPDPWYGAEDGYHDVYALILQTCEHIIEKYK